MCKHGGKDTASVVMLICFCLLQHEQFQESLQRGLLITTAPHAPLAAVSAQNFAASAERYLHKSELLLSTAVRLGFMVMS